MPIVSLKQADIYYQFDDFYKKETLVFSNSLGADLSMWEQQVDILSHHYNILRYDTRGHGKSGSPKEPYTVADLGGDVIGLLDYLKLEKVMFCGLSMGGLIGQYLGIHHPERFSYIVLANTAAKIGNEKGWNDRIAYVSENGLESILEGTAERWFTQDFREEQKETVDNVLKIFAQTDLQGYINNCRVVRDADFTGQLTRLNVPVLIISGLYDAVTTPQDGLFLQQNLTGSKHFIINAAHLSSVEQTEDFSKFVLCFTQN